MREQINVLNSIFNFFLIDEYITPLKKNSSPIGINKIFKIPAFFVTRINKPKRAKNVFVFEMELIRGVKDGVMVMSMTKETKPKQIPLIIALLILSCLKPNTVKSLYLCFA